MAWGYSAREKKSTGAYSQREAGALLIILEKSRVLMVMHKRAGSFASIPRERRALSIVATRE